MTAPERRRPLALLLLSAVLLVLAEPPFPTGWLGLVAFVPFLMALESPGIRRSYLLGCSWSFTLNLLGLYWIAFGHLGAGIGSLIYLTLFDALFFWLMTRLRSGHRALLFPFLWTAFIFVKSLGEMGFPWLTLGLTQTYTAAPLQIASLTGAWGLDFWVASVNTLVFCGLHKIGQVNSEVRIGLVARALLPAALVALAIPLYGRIVLGVGGARESAAATAPAAPDRPRWIAAESEPLAVAAVQGSLRPDVKLAPQLFWHNLYVYDRLTRAVSAAAGNDLDLVFWPESAIPHYLNAYAGVQRFVLRLQRDIGAPILTGAFSSAWDGERSRYYNSAFLVGGGRISTGEEIYHKRLLVPFGERVPYQQVLGFWPAWRRGGSVFGGGRDEPLLGGNDQTPGVPPIGVLICYESLFARLVRTEVVDGARLLTVITNDAWFGRTSGPYQHLRAAALRAVEFRRPIVRAANGGISALVDRWGQIHFATPLYTKSAFIGRVWPETGMTFYARTGDWLPIGACLIALVGLVLFREPRRGRGVSPGGTR